MKCRIKWFRPQLEVLELRCLLSAFYTPPTVMAKSGVLNEVATLASIKPSVSINDLGHTAFVGPTKFPDADYEVIFAPVAYTIHRTPSPEGTFGAELQLGNGGVAAVSRETYPDDPTAATTAAAIHRGGGWVETISFGVSPYVLPNYFGDIDSFASISNDGKLAFSAKVGSRTELHLSNSPVVPGNTATRVRNPIPAGTEYRYMAADGGNVVLATRVGGATTIVLDSPARNATAIASTGSNWTQLGLRPGISDDGRIITFYGALTAAGAQAITTSNGEAVGAPLRPGAGIFASVALGTAVTSRRVIIRVAGVTGNGELDPGELLTTTDIGPDFNYDGRADWSLAWNSSLADSRPGVTNPRNFAVNAAAGGNGGDFIQVVYAALDPAHGSRKAIYSSRLNLFKAANGSYARIGVEAPIQVLRAGESVADLGVIADLALHDPVNNEGTIAAWVKSGATEAVITATPTNRVLLDAQTPGPPQAFINTINTRGRFDPDSPLVDHVVRGVAAQLQRAINPNTSKPIYNQIIVHATDGREPISLKTLASNAVPGTHYLISREGRITQILPESAVANHAAIGSVPNVNARSIGIELVDNRRHRSDPPTAIQYSKAARLVRDIARRRGISLSHPAVLPWTLPQHVNGDRPAVGVDFIAQGGGYQKGALLPGKLDDATSPKSFRDGYNANVRGVLAHGQVLNRSGGKDDYRTFDWTAFDAAYKTSIVFRLDAWPVPAPSPVPVSQNAMAAGLLMMPLETTLIVADTSIPSLAKRAETNTQGASAPPPATPETDHFSWDRAILESTRKTLGEEGTEVDDDVDEMNWSFLSFTGLDTEIH